MWDYTTPYANFVDYTKRKEAVVVEDPAKDRLTEGIDQVTAEEIAKEIKEQTLDYVGYINYMKRNYATKNDSKEFTGIFTDVTLNATTEEAKHLKDMLVEAKNNKSLLWRGVISFDNDFLAKSGVYLPDSKEVDQEMIKKVVQKAMINVIKREKLSDSAFWWGNIHLNTDNIHVHVGLSEIKSARPTFFYAPRNRRERKGKFSQKTIRGIKSNVYNSLVREEVRGNRIDIEKEIAGLRNELLESMDHNERDKLGRLDQFFVDQVISHLPKRNKLRYGSNAEDFKLSKFFIDRYVDHHLKDNISAYGQYVNLTEKLLDSYRYAYNSGSKEEKNTIYQKVTRTYGRDVAHTLRDGSSAEFMDKRLADLRERLGNRALRYIQEVMKNETKEKGNISSLSEGNQERVVEADSMATKVHSKDIWEKMGYKITKGAIPITLVVPVPEEEKVEDGNNKSNSKNKVEFKEEVFYDVRFVEPIDPKKVKLDIDMRSLMSMSKEDLIELVDISQSMIKKGPNVDRVKQEAGIFKYALRQRILKERKKEIDLSLKVLADYTKPAASDRPFLEYKQKQLSELEELVELQLTPKYRMNKRKIQRKKDLQEKYVDVVQVPINKVDQNMYVRQTNNFAEEIKLANMVQDQSIFIALKGENATKDSYIKELSNKSKVIGLKYKISKNNILIKKADSERIKKSYRKENGQYFEELKRLYKELSPEEAKLAQLQLQWDYQHDHAFRKNVSARMDKQRVSASRSSYNRASRGLVKGLSMALKDDSNKREQLLRQLEREERKEQEKER